MWTEGYRFWLVWSSTPALEVLSIEKEDIWLLFRCPRRTIQFKRKKRTNPLKRGRMVALFMKNRVYRYAVVVVSRIFEKVLRVSKIEIFAS